MKRFISVVLLLTMVLSLFGCGGSFSPVNLQEPITIPEDGVIEEKLLRQLKDENAIGTFCGSTDDYQYEWTIFGSDITELRDLNLSLNFLVTQNKGMVAFSFNEKSDLGFPAVLSIRLNQKWDAPSATVYQQVGDQKTAVCSASVTGSKETILNFSVNQTGGDFLIVPDQQAPSESMQVQTEVTEPTATVQEGTAETTKTDEYLSAVEGGGNRVYSDGTGTGQDQYLTDPIPEGKPMPVEPENQEIDSEKSYTCTFSIECSTILNNLSDLNPDKLEMVPSDGVILSTQTVTFYEGESVFDVLKRVCKDNGIHMESSWTPMYNSAYVEGIHNLYEFDCGNLSGWMYRVNGWYPNYGCSRYQLAQGDVVEWRYTCDLGKDVGCEWMG